MTFVFLEILAGPPSLPRLFPTLATIRNGPDDVYKLYTGIQCKTVQ